MQERGPSRHDLNGRYMRILERQRVTPPVSRADRHVAEVTKALVAGRRAQ